MKHACESVVIAAPPADVFGFVDDLSHYPLWMRMVHTVEREPGESIWSVELRAQVGPFARSKRLRMTRSEVEVDRLAAFERAEVDGKQHARWALRAELEPVDSGTRLTMHLAYEGRLWVGGLLERVLDDEIRHGSQALTALVNSASTR